MHYFGVRVHGADVHVCGADVRVQGAQRGFSVISDSSRALVHSNRNCLIHYGITI